MPNLPYLICYELEKIMKYIKQTAIWYRIGIWYRIWSDFHFASLPLQKVLRQDHSLGQNN